MFSLQFIYLFFIKINAALHKILYSKTLNILIPNFWMPVYKNTIFGQITKKSDIYGIKIQLFTSNHSNIWYSWG